MCHMDSRDKSGPAVSSCSIFKLPKLTWPSLVRLPRPARKLILIGAEGSGKTTFSLRLQHGEAINSPATLGISIHRLKHASQELQLIDVGGNGMCHRTRPELKNYYDRESVALFFHDSNSRNIKESIQLLHAHVQEMLDAGARFLWVVLNKRDAITEKDKHRLYDIAEMFEPELERYTGRVIWRIWDVAGFSGLDGVGTTGLMDDVLVVTTAHNSFNPSKYVNTIPSFMLERGEAGEENLSLYFDLSTTVNVATSRDSAGREQPSKISKEHSERMHATYLVMLQSLKQDRGITETAELLLQQERRTGQEKYCGNRTMVTFWLLQMQAVILDHSSMHSGSLPLAEDFDGLIAHAEQLHYPETWRRYYSDYLMNSPESSLYWRLPDLADFPFQTAASTVTPYHLTSSESSTTQYSERLPRYAYSVVKTYLTTNLSRNSIVELALSSLQQVTIRQRYHAAQAEVYSETQAYFWIQHIHWLLTCHLPNVLNSNSDRTLLQDMDYAEVKTLITFGANAWQMYYSATRWESIEARLKFLPPDKQLLPVGTNGFRLKDCPTIESGKMWLQKRGLIPELPSEEELAFQLGVIIMQASAPPPINIVSSHANLLLVLFKEALRASIELQDTKIVNTVLDRLDTRVVLQANNPTVKFWAEKVCSGMLHHEYTVPTKMPATDEEAVSMLRDMGRHNLPLVHGELSKVWKTRKEAVGEALFEKQEFLGASDHGDQIDPGVMTFEVLTSETENIFAADDESDRTSSILSRDSGSIVEEDVNGSTLCLLDQSEWELIEN